MSDSPSADSPVPPARPKRKRPPVQPIPRLTRRAPDDDAEDSTPVAVPKQGTAVAEQAPPMPKAAVPDPATVSVLDKVDPPKADVSVPKSPTGNLAAAAANRGNGNHAAYPPYPAFPSNALSQRFLPRSEIVPVPAGALPAIAVAGVVAAVSVPLDRPGIGWLLAGLVIAGAIYLVDRRARRVAEPSAVSESDSKTTEDTAKAVARKEPVAPLLRWGAIWWTSIALGLLAVGAFRAAGWLFVLCVLGAGVALSLAVLPRSTYGLAFDIIAVPVRASMSIPWLARGIQRIQVRRVSAAQRIGWSVLATAALLLVFVPLLMGADAVFAKLVTSVTPTFEGSSVVQWVFVGTVAALSVGGALYLLASPPADSGTNTVVTRLVQKRWSPLEWGLPLGALTILFGVFVATQLAVLFGGNDYVQQTAGPDYAEYARSGFWQLSVVSMLTLGVIAAVQTWAAQESAGDRRWLRIAVAAVSVLTLIIVASALHRMWTYQQAYGFTVLRLLVEVFELWIGVVYLLVLASLVRLRRHWIPRAAMGTALATLFVLACVNPEALIAHRNIDRWVNGATVEVSGGRQIKPALDLDYLDGLSPDALPATERLPEELRRRIADSIRSGVGEDSWQGWNWSRANAR
ncbi:DUF4173 domain-containing protein [Nocardia sp. NPDC050712]|uniref:DUF4153 domain-containing protein n=1 Tax=Nocardia sp. NPDC050712 TaxID=3155518 RepID=UPI0033EBB28A